MEARGHGPTGVSYGPSGTKLLALSATELGVGVLLVAARTYTTLTITKAPRWDLWCTIIATVFAISAEPFLALAVRYGSGNDIGRVRPDDMRSVLLFQYISFTPIMLSTIFSKAATGLLILQIQDRTVKHRKWMIYVILLANTIVTLLLTIALWFQCSPLSELWTTDSAMNPHCGFARVVNTMAIVQGSIGAFTDFFLALYPAIIFWQLQMSLKRRLGLCVLFFGGCFAGASSVVRITHTTAGLTDPNATKAVAELLLWWNTESWLIIWVSTIPPLQPLFGRGLKSVARSLTASQRRSTALDGTRDSAKYAKEGYNLRELESGSALPRLPDGVRRSRRNSRLGGGGGGKAMGQSLVEVDSDEELILPASRDGGGGGIVKETDITVKYSQARL